MPRTKKPQEALTSPAPPAALEALKSRPTVRDVARLAGVAIGTVSRVVNGAENVNPEVRQRVLQASATLGWKPNVVAQNMRGQATRMIGFIFSDLENPLYASMIKGAEDVLTQAGYLLIVGSSNHQPGQEQSLIDLFGQRQADGLIFTITDEKHPAVLDCIARARFPIVMLEREVAVDTAGLVLADHLNGIRHATKHLLDLGHERIALVCGGRETRVGRDRLQGFYEAHEAKGLQPDPDLLRIDTGTAAHAFGFRQTQLLLALPEPPTAIMALGRHLLRGVLLACRAKAVRIPEEVSLITTNDSDLAELTVPAITAIRYSAYELGREAAQLLLQRLASNAADWSFSSIQVPTELILRDSCAVPARRVAAPGR